MSRSDGNYGLVDDQAAVERLVPRIASLQRVPLDTEGDSFYHYYEKVCLIQVAAGEECYLVDPLPASTWTGCWRRWPSGCWSSTGRTTICG
ncbi:MAG: hypothetical protein ACODAJ_06715 [Planctomycetota bacterium]